MPRRWSSLQLGSGGRTFVIRVWQKRPWCPQTLWLVLKCWRGQQDLGSVLQMQFIDLSWALLSSLQVLQQAQLNASWTKISGNHFAANETKINIAWFPTTSSVLRGFYFVLRNCWTCKLIYSLNHFTTDPLCAFHCQIILKCLVWLKTCHFSLTLFPCWLRLAAQW